MSEPMTDERCAMCGAAGVTGREEKEQFSYGVTDPAILEAMVLLMSCSECGARWTGADAEATRTDVVCRYLQKENARLRHELAVERVTSRELSVGLMRIGYRIRGDSPKSAEELLVRVRAAAAKEIEEEEKSDANKS